MPISFSIYLTQLVNALQSENGPDLAYLLRPTSPHGKDLVKELRNPTVRLSLDSETHRANKTANSVKHSRVTKEA